MLKSQETFESKSSDPGVESLLTFDTLKPLDCKSSGSLALAADL